MSLSVLAVHYIEKKNHHAFKGLCHILEHIKWMLRLLSNVVIMKLMCVYPCLRNLGPMCAIRNADKTIHLLGNVRKHERYANFLNTSIA